METCNASCDSEGNAKMSKIFIGKAVRQTLFAIRLYIEKLFYLCTKNVCNGKRWGPRWLVNRIAAPVTLEAENGEKIWLILKVSCKWKGTRGRRSSYRIESMLSSFVPWLFHNRLWYNSARSCIPYVYAPETPTSGRVNIISRCAYVAYFVWRIY